MSDGYGNSSIATELCRKRYVQRARARIIPLASARNPLTPIFGIKRITIEVWQEKTILAINYF